MALADLLLPIPKRTIAALCCVLLVGCPSAQKFKQPAQPAGKFLVHVVSSDEETLAKVSEWYADGTKSQKAIVAANPGKDLSSLSVGEQVLIPYSVVKRLEPLGAGLPRPAGKANVEEAAEVEEVVPASAALDDDFVDLPEGGQLQPTPKPSPAHTATKTPRKPVPETAPEPSPELKPSAPRERQVTSQQPLDPLEELAATAGKAQGAQPPGVPVGIPQPALETFDEAPVPQPNPQRAPADVAGEVPAKQPEADASVDELRRELGLTQ